MKLQDPKIFEEYFNKVAVKKVDWSDKYQKSTNWIKKDLMKYGLSASAEIRYGLSLDMKELRKAWYFKNGFGISVIRGLGTSGASKGKFEIAVMMNWEICFYTKVINDVIGYLTSKQVLSYGKKIERLTMKEYIARKL